MDNKQRRKLLSSIFRSITFFSVLAIGLIIYLCIDKIIKAENNVLWLDITLLSVSGVLLLYILVQNVKTKKSSNQYGTARFFYLFFKLCFLAAIVLAVYCYVQKIDVLSYVAYALPLGLVYGVELILIVNLILGIYLTRLNKNSTVIIDSVSEVPNFDDEVQLKKKLNELNRKLEMKKIQDKIDRVEKELEEK